MNESKSEESTLTSSYYHRGKLRHADVKNTSLRVNTIADVLFFSPWLTDSVGENLTLFNFHVMCTLEDPVGLIENY